MKNFLHISEVSLKVKIAAQRDHTLSELSLVYVDPKDKSRREIVSGYGSAHRDGKDFPNEEIGEKLAIAKALESLASQLKRQANGLISNAETERARGKEIDKLKAEGKWGKEYELSQNKKRNLLHDDGSLRSKRDLPILTTKERKSLKKLVASLSK